MGLDGWKAGLLVIAGTEDDPGPVPRACVFPNPSLHLQTATPPLPTCLLTCTAGGPCCAA